MHRTLPGPCRSAPLVWMGLTMLLHPRTHLWHFQSSYRPPQINLAAFAPHEGQGRPNYYCCCHFRCHCHCWHLSHSDASRQPNWHMPPQRRWSWHKYYVCMWSYQHCLQNSSLALYVWHLGRRPPHPNPAIPDAPARRIGGTAASIPATTIAMPMTVAMAKKS